MIFGRLLRSRWAALCLTAGVLLACDAEDTSVGVTSENDFTLTLEVVDRFVHVGDEAPVTLRLKRVDNSNLQRGMGGEIVITTSAHGSVNLSNVSIEVFDDTTPIFVRNLVFTAGRPGVAEVRASFLDATAVVKVLISGVDI